VKIARAATTLVSNRFIVFSSSGFLFAVSVVAHHTLLSEKVYLLLQEFFPAISKRERAQTELL
jgi:hypothetical protein